MKKNRMKKIRAVAACFSRSFCAVACVDRTRAEAPRYFDNKHNYTRSGQEGMPHLTGALVTVNFFI